MRSSASRLAALLLPAFLGACSSSPKHDETTFSGQGGTDGTSIGTGGTANSGGTNGGLLGDGGGSNGCIATTCAVQGKNCGIVADGCGSTLDCGSCADGQLCGVVTGNVCTALQDLCHPLSHDEACAGKACGIEGDGCGSTIECGTCPDGQQCGLEQAFQCGVVPGSSATDCPARITSCASVGAGCGLIGNGCGGTIDCTAELGACGAGELCGINSPQQCGSFPTCQPLLAAAVCPGKCGLVSNGCGPEVNGGVIDCNIAFPCPNGESCGGGGVLNQCGSGGAVCTPIAQGTACGANECGVVSNGCGASYSCGLGCDVGELCVAGSCQAQVCIPVPQVDACLNKSCGQVGNGCGSTYTCGTCSGNQTCGGNAPFQCSTPAGQTCTPRTNVQACAGKECGTAYDGCGTAPANTFNCATVNGTHTGSCASGEFCGLATPFQCDAPVIPPCTPTATSCAQLGWACGQAINNCGTIYDCALESRTCNNTQACVGGVTGPTTCESPGSNGGGADCDLCDDVPTCSGQPQQTRITGRVITPGRNDANTANQIGVPNAFVYILRNNDVNDLPAMTAGIPNGGLSCDRCADQDLGPVLASAVSDSSGNFTIEGNVPVNTPFLLVTKIGKFRRAVSMTVPSNKACLTTTLATTMPNNPTRLPRTLVGDGLAVNIPQISISTGRIDAMECVFEKMGVAATEFSRPQLSGRVKLFRSDGAWPDQQSANCNACGTSGNGTDTTCRTNNCGGSTTAARTAFLTAVSDASLHGTPANMLANDMVVFDCEGGGWDSGFTQRDANGANIRDYVNRGGRMFLSHLSFSWLSGNGSTAYSAGTALQTGLNAAGTWNNTLYTDTTGTGVVSITPALPAHPRRSPRIQTFADWMVNESVTAAPNYTFTISDPRSMNTGLGTSSEEFVYRSDGNARVQQFSFNTPYGAPTDAACGRVAYSGFHVAPTGGGTAPFQTAVFPTHCQNALANNGNFTNQEKILLFMLFDLGTCVGVEPEPPACEPLTCPTNGTCGRLPDGCGGHIDCGCVAGSACVANQCVQQDCTPTTCAAEGVICSSIDDGCGTTLACPCPVCTPVSQQTACTGQCGFASDGCSGVHQCATCPQGCTPLTQCPPGINCGVISDGCSGTLSCGTCPSGQACGVGGPNVCGNPQCEPLGCYDVNAGCGAIGNGCGGSVQCGTCPPGQICTIVNGVPNQCAGCVRSTQQAACAGLNCGTVGDGCGGTYDCGQCPSGQTCGAQAPNQCGTGPQCNAQTCQAAGAQCGIIGDGCGGQVNCGNCPAGKLCGVNSPYQCGDAPVCNPATCNSLGANCGQVGDGCGGLLDCGVCPSGFTCGLGQANVCAQIR